MWVKVPNSNTAYGKMFDKIVLIVADVLHMSFISEDTSVPHIVSCCQMHQSLTIRKELAILARIITGDKPSGSSLIDAFALPQTPLRTCMTPVYH